MTPLVLAIRAIATEFAQRVYTIVLIVAAAIIIVLIAVSIWLVSMSAWWWVLVIVFIAWILLGAILLTIAGVIITMTRPLQTKAQKKLVKTFVDKLQSVSEVLQTPRFMLLFRLVKTSLNPQRYNIIKNLTEHTVGLQRDLDEIIRSFRSTN